MKKQPKLVKVKRSAHHSTQPPQTEPSTEIVPNKNNSTKPVKTASSEFPEEIKATLKLLGRSIVARAAWKLIDVLLDTDFGDRQDDEIK